MVFDTTTVVSALLFASGRLAWLRQHWRESACVPLISRATAAELTRVLQCPKFRLRSDDGRELLADYLPYCEVIERQERCPFVCRDANDQSFLDLAQSGSADALVSGDRDLSVLAGQTAFLIETPEGYRRGIPGAR
ncbi:MAG: putative toxin-antitoxin system toxin component, PIN family [Candidatus Sulfotelmatobacter sp.]